MRHITLGTTTWTSTSYGEHQMDTAWTTENDSHFHKCLVSGCSHVADSASCSGGMATCQAKAICATCKKEYGELLNHSLGEWIVTKEAT